MWPNGLDLVSHVGLRSEIIFIKFERSTYPFLTYNVFTADTLCHAVNMIFDPLTSKAAIHRVSRGQILYKISVRSEQFATELSMI